VEDPVHRQRLLLETVRFPTYGLEPEWQGPRWLASIASFEGTAGGVSLCHGWPAGGAGPMVRVESYAPTSDFERPGAEDALFRLMVIVERLSHGPATPEEQRAFQERARSRAASAPVRELGITVCGDSVPFSIVGEEPLWAAVPATRELGLNVQGVGTEPSQLRLVTVDPHEYLAGMVALARE
jgi:hypothetical protein